MSKENSRKIRDRIYDAISIILCLFVLVIVNTTWMGQQPRLALFAMQGLILVFLSFPFFFDKDEGVFGKISVGLFLAATVFSFGYVFVQSDDMFSRFWVDGTSLGNRAGVEKQFEFVIGLIGVLLILEATRRSIGWTLPILTVIFVLYGFYGQSMPDWLFPHRGLSWEQMLQKTFFLVGRYCGQNPSSNVQV